MRLLFSPALSATCDSFDDGDNDDDDDDDDDDYDDDDSDDDNNGNDDEDKMLMMTTIMKIAMTMKSKTLKLNFSQCPSIHTNYIISHCTTL